VKEALGEVKSLVIAKQLASTAPSLNISGIRSALAAKTALAIQKGLDKKDAKEYNERVYAIVAHEFFRRIDPRTMQQVQKKHRKHAPDFLRWLAETPEVMLEFIELGPTPYVESSFLSDWAEIWQKYPESRTGAGRTLAVALAHANLCGHMNNHIVRHNISAVERYGWLAKSLKANAFLRDVKTMSHFDLRFVAGARFSDKDLEWCQNYYATRPVSWKSPDRVHLAMRETTYRQRNSKGVHVSQSKVFYEGNAQSIPVYVKYGGMCVPVSRTGVAFCSAAGVPAFLVVQPDHLAFYWKDTGGRWRGGNDIRGWQNSREYLGDMPWHGTPAVILLYDQFHSDLGKSRESLLYSWLGNGAAALNQPAQRFALYKTAVEKDPLNYEAVESLLGMFSARSANAKQIREFMFSNVFPAYKEHPFVTELILGSALMDGYLRHERDQIVRRAHVVRIGTVFAKSEGRPAFDSQRVAVLRFFLRNSSLRVDTGAHADSLDARVRAYLRGEKSLDERSVLNELGLWVRATLADKTMSEQMFSYIEDLVRRDVNLKLSAQRQVELLAEKGCAKDVSERVAAWVKRLAAIERPKPETKRAKPKKV
jgi:hypothetical protein